MFYETTEVRNAQKTGLLYVLAQYWLTEASHDRLDDPYFIEEFGFSQHWFRSRDNIPTEVEQAVENRWRIAVQTRERGDATARATITTPHIRRGVVIRRTDQRAREPTRVDDNDPHGLLAEPGVIAMRGAKHDRPGAVRP